MGDVHHCSGPPVSEMTYTVLSGTLNSTIPYHTISHDINRPGDVDLWPFDLLMESPSFLVLVSGMGQTDGQTDNGHQCI